jgi:cellulose synthase operon protein C
MTPRAPRLTARLVAVAVAAAVAAPAWAQPDPLPGEPRGPGLGLPRSTLTPEEREVLRDVEAQWQRYVDAADHHHRRLRQEVLGELERRVAQLEKRFAERLAKAGADKAQWRQTTKELLLKFIKEHPGHDQFTPDARYRLADVYLDEADDAIDAIDDPTAAVIADYSLSLEQWETILKDFPEYRQMPSVLYLLGYYLKATGTDDRRSVLLFLSLTCANHYKWTDPPPPLPTKQEALARIEQKQYVDPYASCRPWPDADVELLRHAWVRGLADYHFNVPGELDHAISGYLQVADKGKDSPLYAEALYKLAWSFYKKDHLLESIKRFDESVLLYDRTIAANQQPPLELREESLQYIAVAFTDPWPGETDTDPDKAFQRARDFYKGRESEPHVRDVWVALGNAFIELQAFDQAVDSYRIALGPPWELHPDAPVVHQQIVDAYELSGDRLAADAAAAELATRYAEGTPWYAANEKNREAMDNQRRIAERALYASALNTHSAAKARRDEWEAGGGRDAALRAEYLDLYNRAIELYQTFIRQYPDSDYVYLFTYMMGEAMYFSGRYLEAIEQYTWVRDHRDLSSDLFVDAAKGVLASYEQQVAAEVAAGRLSPLAAPTPEELKAMPQPIQAQRIPDLYLKLQGEWDHFQEIVPDPQSAPEMGINAAIVSAAHLHLDDAIRRFHKVLELHCGTEPARKAKDGLLAIHDARGDLDKFREVNDRFIDRKCGDAAAIQAAQSQNRSIELRAAELLLAEHKYLEAGDAYYTYYKKAPNDDADKPLALYNAAVAYLQGDRPKTAISLFKEFTQSKEKTFRDSPFFLRAMKATAYSYQTSYDYKNAIAGYLDLYDVAMAAKKKGIKPPPPLPGEKAQSLDEIALESLYNAAVLAELDRDFTRAVTYYRKYDAEEPDRRNSDRAQWAIARIYSTQGDVANLVKTYDAWRKTYGKDAGNQDDYVFSYHDLAKAYQRKGKTKDANTAGQAAIDAFTTIGAAPGGRGARLAAEWSLVFAERHFTGTWEKFQITKKAKNLDEAKKFKKQIMDAAVATQQKYKVLERYGVLEYSLAAKVRYGDTLAMYAEKLVAMPYPKDLEAINNKDPSAGVLAIYEETLRKELEPYLLNARQEWIEVVDSAKKAQVSNTWSQLALENLNREWPDEFEVLHQELFEGTDQP